MTDAERLGHGRLEDLATREVYMGQQKLTQAIIEDCKAKLLHAKQDILNRVQTAKSEFESLDLRGGDVLRRLVINHVNDDGNLDHAIFHAPERQPEQAVHRIRGLR